jgi:hypothetical protein
MVGKLIDKFPIDQRVDMALRFYQKHYFENDQAKINFAQYCFSIPQDSSFSIADSQASLVRLKNVIMEGLNEKSEVQSKQLDGFIKDACDKLDNGLNSPSASRLAFLREGNISDQLAR